MGSSGRTLYPENITIANNLFSVPDDGTLLKGRESESFNWLGNLAMSAKSESQTNHAGIEIVVAKLARATDGLWRPAASSPIRGAAQGDYSEIKGDIDGQARIGRVDVGCDQISDAPVTNRPLRAKDVGPTWLERSSEPK
jgi:poly(beta-D-mannuronate) lyase